MRAFVNTVSVSVFDMGRTTMYFVVSGIVIVIFLFIVSLETMDGFLSNPFLYVYTISVTVFQLSRLAAAMFYRQSYEAVQADAAEKFYEPGISFVIPCKNEEDAIMHTVTKCFEAHYPKEKLEVIVINDGSTDRTIEILRALQQERFPELLVIDWPKNRGKRHAMAEGFRRAKGEIIIQLDSDSYIDPHSIRELVKPFRNSRIGAVCAHTDPVNADANWLTKMQTAYYFLAFRILKAAESTFLTVFCCCGCASAYRKDVVTPILDEWLAVTFLGKPATWDDDRALTNFILRLGYNTVYADMVQAYTIVPTKLMMFLRQQIRWNKAWLTSSVFASKFIWKQRPFVAYTYFFPNVLFTFLTPFIIFRLLILHPITQHITPVLYMTGLGVYAALVVLYYMSVAGARAAYRYWPYVFVWSALSLILLSFVFLYALLTIQNRAWGTR